MTLLIVHAVVVLTILPLLTLRGRALRGWLAIDMAMYALAAMVWPQVAGVDPRLAAIGFVAVKLALFFVAQATTDEVRWSPGRGALQALLVLSLVVPQTLRVPIDGDEPFYVLITESIVQDRDLDLANQYRTLDRTASGRTDLKPQFGDPVGSSGEQYSRHEPFLPLLLIPGYLMAGLPGAVATMVLFGALLVRSTLRLFEDEGIPDGVARAVFPFFAFGPPLIFYATRIWPEVPAAFFFVEAIRGIRNRRAGRWVPALLMMSLLKLRFALVALPLCTRFVIRSRRNAMLAAIAVAVPLLVLWMASGSVMSVHSLRDIAPGGPREYLRGFFGLMLDGAAGVAFQAPFYLLGLFAITRWRLTPESFRLGLIGASLYILLLIPRTEWHGGWGPPLRYIAFLTPILALGAAAVWDRIPRTLIAVVGVWTVGLVIHGVTFPWRLFHLANGENVLGEALSLAYQSDFSRLFPSFIRLNQAGVVAALTLVVAGCWWSVVGSRWSVVGGRALTTPFVIPVFVMLVAAAFTFGRMPARIAEFEDAHVIHHGGEVHPPPYAFARFVYRGGWILHEGDSLTFLARRGMATLHYATGIAATIDIAG
ncbi:MAG: hypothetical protein ABIO78_02540, partial [Thermoanaerobaculia bacterium]